MSNFDWVALYGAVLSTIIFAREWITSRSKLRVTVAHGVSDQFKEACMVVRVSNHGHRPLRLFHVGLLWKYRAVGWRDRVWDAIRYKRFRHIGWVHGTLPPADPDHNFPCIIEPLQSADFWVPFSAIDEASADDRNIIIASAQDALGRNSYSRPFQRRGVEILRDTD